jgi:hypothetical protein
MPNLSSLEGVESCQKNKIQGKCIKNLTTYCIISLPNNSFGALHYLNNWGQDLPEVGGLIDVVIVGIFNSKFNLARYIPGLGDQTFYSLPQSKPSWKKFCKQNAVGDVIEVQNLYWCDRKNSYTIATKEGVVGYVSKLDTDWFCSDINVLKTQLKPSEKFKAVITDINYEKKGLTLSRRAADSESIGKVLSGIDLEKTVEGRVTWTSKLGCFVFIQKHNLQALLHRSNIPKRRVFEQGEILDLLFDSIDLPKSRVTVKLDVC